MYQTKPTRLASNRHKRNIVIAALAISALIVSGLLFVLSNIPKQQQILVSPIETDNSNIEDIEVDNLNTVDNAKNTIRDYYNYLATSNSEGLRNIGAHNAADAIERGWLNNIGYSISLDNLSNPSIDSFPASVGIYAGCSIYRLEDFFDNPPQNIVSSYVTGNTGVVGWIYYNSANSTWVIVDPTIPTAVSVAESSLVRRASIDNFASVQLTSQGAYSNPWWAFAQITVEISNLSNTYEVWCEQIAFDNGITVETADDIFRTTPISSGNGTPSITRGVCKIYRGDTSNFTIERIGDKSLVINGDICPVNVTYNEERISPIFAIGNISSENVISLMSQEQIDRYNATGEIPPSIDESVAEIVDTVHQQQAELENNSADEEQQEPAEDNNDE